MMMIAKNYKDNYFLFYLTFLKLSPIVYPSVMNLKVHRFQSYINKIHHTIVYTGSIAEYHDGWLRILLSQYVSCIDSNTIVDGDLLLTDNTHFQSAIEKYKYVTTNFITSKNGNMV